MKAGCHRHVGRTPPLLLLAFFAFCGTAGMHIFVPAFAVVARDLAIDPRVMQFDVSLYVIGLATGQLIYGPLSDMIGRRPAMMAGVALYTAAGLVVVVAPGFGFLIVARLLQALGGSAGIVLPRVIIRDSAEPREAVRQLALMGLIVACGPGFAPIIGSAMVSVMDWRFIPLALAIFGACMLAAAWHLLPETRPRAVALARTSYWSAYKSLLATPAFLAFAIGGGGGGATTSVYAFYGGASFLFIEEFGRPVGEVGLYLGLLVFSTWIGSLLTSQIVARTSVATVVTLGSAITLLSALLFLVLLVGENLTMVSTVLTMCCYSIGVGISLPAAIIRAVSVRPDLTGSASGVYGFLQMSFGGLCSAAVTLFEYPPTGVAIVLCLAGLITHICFFVGGRLSRQAP